MKSAAASLRIARQNEIFRSAIKNALDKLSKGQSVRVSTKVAKHILIAYPTIVTFPTRVRNIGAGVKELYLDF